MLRYVVIACAIVLLAGMVAASLHRSAGDVRIASVRTTASPSPPRFQAESTFTPGPLVGDAPWAFVALVDCFRHERTYRGALVWVRAHVPRDARLLRDGTTLTSGPCVVRVSPSGVLARRGLGGPDAVDVRIPPPALLFVLGGPGNPAVRGRRDLYVLRWKPDGDARLDRLATMPDSRMP
jgi:hypothetical protein